MLSMSDTDINQFFKLFASTGVAVAFLVPTPTGFEKSIMDATAPIRELLLNENIHNYETQEQGPSNKVIVKTHLISIDSIMETETSLYRPVTKKGDPRIWIYNLKKYCKPYNLLSLFVIDKELYVFNLSNKDIQNSLFNNGYCYEFLSEASHKKASVAIELLEKLKIIHNKGFLRSITPGDPGVGDTLENALGISRNNSKNPDYKGIELKSTRLTRNGKTRSSTRSTLFTKVPDEGMTYREIVDNYGKIQTPKNSTIARLQLYETLFYSRPNAYDLILSVDENNDRLKILHQTRQVNILKTYVSAWIISNLKQTLLTKHHETFWVKALSENHDGIEYFRYDKVLHTKNPNTSLLIPLIEEDKITIDLAAHYKPDGGWRDHGILFKMKPDDLPLLLGEPTEYIL